MEKVNVIHKKVVKKEFSLFTLIWVFIFMFGCSLFILTISVGPVMALIMTITKGHFDFNTMMVAFSIISFFISSIIALISSYNEKEEIVHEVVNKKKE